VTEEPKVHAVFGQPLIEAIQGHAVSWNERPKASRRPIPKGDIAFEGVHQDDSTPVTLRLPGYRSRTRSLPSELELSSR